MGSPEKFQATNTEEIKSETIKAVQEGRALPTPEFASEEGGEMLAALESEIKKMSKDQLDGLYQGLNHALYSTDFNASIRLLTSKEFLAKIGAPAAFGGALLGFLIGGFGGALVGGTGAYLATTGGKDFPEAEKQAAKNKIKNLERLVAVAKERL